MNKETENINGGNEMLGGTYWSNRYDTDDTGWDLGQVSPPIKAYIDQLEHKNLRILIPGCGNTYEAEYLLQQGFTDVTVIDIAPTLVAKLKQKFAQLTDDDLLFAEGKKDEMMGKLQVKLGKTKEEMHKVLAEL